MSEQIGFFSLASTNGQIFYFIEKIEAIKVEPPNPSTTKSTSLPAFCPQSVRADELMDDMSML